MVIYEGNCVQGTKIAPTEIKYSEEAFKFTVKFDQALQADVLTEELFTIKIVSESDNINDPATLTSFTMEEGDTLMVFTIAQPLRSYFKATGVIEISNKSLIYHKDKPYEALDQSSFEAASQFTFTSEQEKAIASSGQAASTSMSIISVVVALISMRVSMELLKLYQMFEFLIFLNIPHPINVRMFLSSLKSGSVSDAVPDMFKDFHNDVCEDIGKKFQEEQMGCQAIGNLSSSLGIIVGFLFARGLLVLIWKASTGCRSSSKVKNGDKKIKAKDGSNSKDKKEKKGKNEHPLDEEVKMKKSEKEDAKGDKKIARANSTLNSAKFMTHKSRKRRQKASGTKFGIFGRKGKGKYSGLRFSKKKSTKFEKDKKGIRLFDGNNDNAKPILGDKKQATKAINAKKKKKSCSKKLRGFIDNSMGWKTFYFLILGNNLDFFFSILINIKYYKPGNNISDLNTLFSFFLFMMLLLFVCYAISSLSKIIESELAKADKKALEAKKDQAAAITAQNKKNKEKSKKNTSKNGKNMKKGVLDNGEDLSKMVFLTEGVKTTSSFSRYFNVIVMLRDPLIAFFVVLFYDQPLVQSCGTLVVMTVLTGMELIYRPLTSCKEMIIKLITDVCFTVINFCLFFVFLQEKATDDPEIEKVGYITIVLLCVIILANVLPSLWDSVISAKDFIKKICCKPKEAPEDPSKASENGIEKKGTNNGEFDSRENSPLNKKKESLSMKRSRKRKRKKQFTLGGNKQPAKRSSKGFGTVKPRGLDSKNSQELELIQ